MSKANEFFIPINEVAKRLDVPAYTLRYWEKQFPGAVRPVTGAGNRRYYRAETIEKLETIKTLLYDKGMTIVGVKKILHNGTFKDEIQDAKKTTVQTLSPDMISQPKPKAISALDMGDIESAIKLLNQAKMFLD
jgi:DNA-binding transcriptional MerR regulator